MFHGRVRNLSPMCTIESESNLLPSLQEVFFFRGFVCHNILSRFLRTVGKATIKTRRQMVITPVPSTESQPGMHGQKPNRFRLTFAKLTPLSSSMRIFAAPGSSSNFRAFPCQRSAPPSVSSCPEFNFKRAFKAPCRMSRARGPTHWGVCWSWSQIYWTSASCPVCSYFMRAFDKKASHFSLCLASFSFCFCSFFSCFNKAFAAVFVTAFLGGMSQRGNKELKSLNGFTP